MEQLAIQIKQMELTLLHTDMQANPSLPEELLSEEFEEIGSDGRINSRQAVVEWLMNKDNQLKWSLEDFRVKTLSNDLVMAIYRTKARNEAAKVHQGSIRSSIWRRRGDSWEMVFHQATKLI